MWNATHGYVPPVLGYPEEKAAAEAMMKVLMNVPLDKWGTVIEHVQTFVQRALAGDGLPEEYLKNMLVRLLAEDSRMRAWQSDPVYRSLWKDDVYHLALMQNGQTP